MSPAVSDQNSPDKHPYVITPLFFTVRGSGPRLVGRIGSGVRVSVSFRQKNTRRVLSYDVLRQKIAVFTYRSPHFCFPWRRPCDYHTICCTDERQFNACQTPRSMYLYIFNSFRVSCMMCQCGLAVCSHVGDVGQQCFVYNAWRHVCVRASGSSESNVISRHRRTCLSLSVARVLFSRLAGGYSR